MACTVAENVPLAKLRTALSIRATCHSSRPICIKGVNRLDIDTAALAAPGAAIGYCQALFRRRQNPAEHTNHVIETLSRVGAPWKLSHELFWGYRGDMTPQSYLDEAMRPLLGVGRVPILITGIDPATDRDALQTILTCRPPIAEGETMLVRVALRSHDSVVAIRSVMRSLFDDAASTMTMPLWWPLLQAPFSNDVWANAAEMLGELWPYTCVAVNPFSDLENAETIASQVCVAQIVVSDLAGFGSDGSIMLPAGMTIMGAGEAARYSLPSFVDGLAKLPAVPTLILLGPSAEWSDDENAARVARAIDGLRSACETLWQDLPLQRRAYLWALAA